jgi:hypothetical protein
LENNDQSTEQPFEWLNFWEYFDIRDTSRNQGDYQKSLVNAFSQLETDELKIRLLNLLDLQLIIQLEMIYANNEYWEAQLDKATPIRFHTSKPLRLKELRIPTQSEIDAFFAPDPEDAHLKEKALRDEIESNISGRYDTLHARLQLNDDIRFRHSLPGRVARFSEVLNLYLENGNRDKLSITPPSSTN